MSSFERQAMAHSILSQAAIVVATAIASTPCCSRAPEGEPVAAQPMSAPTSIVPPPPPIQSSEPASPAISASAAAPAAGLGEVPLLNGAKAERALAAYRAILRRACSNGVDRRKAFAGIGLEIEHEDFICVGLEHTGKALASGALVEAGADEVLLQGPSGRSRAGGDSALALMRSDGQSYQLVKHVSFGNDAWIPLIRITTPSGRDILMLCHEGGQQGVYTGTCGFLDDISFEQDCGPGTHASTNNTIPTLSVTLCGPQASVTLGKIEFRDNRLYAPLFVDEYVREPEGPDEVAGGAYCSRTVRKSRKTFTIQYHFDGTRFQSVTPTPREVDEILKRY